jgi:hypothetical protein
VGETLACGTGASAAAVVATVLGRVDPTKPVHAHLTGGDLTLRVDFSPTAASTCPQHRSVGALFPCSCSNTPAVSASHFPTRRVVSCLQRRAGTGTSPSSGCGWKDRLTSSSTVLPESHCKQTNKNDTTTNLLYNAHACGFRRSFRSSSTLVKSISRESLRKHDGESET